MAGRSSSSVRVWATLSGLMQRSITAEDLTGAFVDHAGAQRMGAFAALAGMPQEIQERVFEPFFTTKDTEGTGLGLAMVYATMQRHGGTVTLETAPGAGAAFTLWFPGAGSGS